MKRTKKTKGGMSDHDDAPELTAALAKRLRPASEMLPPDLYGALVQRKPGQRGKQRKPTKKPIYIRLDPEILDYFKSTGGGWQSRINNFLKAAIANLPAHH